MRGFVRKGARFDALLLAVCLVFDPVSTQTFLSQPARGLAHARFAFETEALSSVAAWQHRLLAGHTRYKLRDRTGGAVPAMPEPALDMTWLRKSIERIAPALPGWAVMPIVSLVEVLLLGLGVKNAAGYTVGIAAGFGLSHYDYSPWFAPVAGFWSYGVMFLFQHSPLGFVFTWLIVSALQIGANIVLGIVSHAIRQRRAARWYRSIGGQESPTLLNQARGRRRVLPAGITFEEIRWDSNRQEEIRAEFERLVYQAAYWAKKASDPGGAIDYLQAADGFRRLLSYWQTPSDPTSPSPAIAWVAQDPRGQIIGARVLEEPRINSLVDSRAVTGADAVEVLWQGNGLATELRRRALEWMRRRGEPLYLATIHAENPASLRSLLSAAAQAGIPVMRVGTEQEAPWYLLDVDNASGAYRGSWFHRFRSSVGRRSGGSA